MDTQAAERFTEKLLQLIEQASGRKLSFSLIANLQTGKTETVESKITRAILQLEADAERRGLQQIEAYLKVHAPTFTGDTVSTYNMGVAAGYRSALNRFADYTKEKGRYVEMIPAADVRALEEALQKIIRWCQPSLSKTEPTKITGAFFAGTVTPTAEAVLAQNVINIAKQALGPGEDQ
jgi:hypothetical protein